ncbi:MAG: triose-phosphate isomerase [Phycisphaerales bacterium]|nr:MAG: triose-phosphate isomerase [Phycisphaerales bacterium]
MRRPIVGGNWKMHLTRIGAVRLAREVGEGLRAHDVDAARLDVGVFPPFVYLDSVGTTLSDDRSPLELGAQDLHPEPEGAFTGEVSAPMLLDVGARAVLVGHSERRHVIGEPESLIRRKTHAALAAGLRCVLCVGELLDERDAGTTNEVNERQLRSALEGAAVRDPDMLVIAYEPVWAIGTGRTATPQDAQQAHAHIRRVLADVLGTDAAARVRIQYGGSVKPANAKELFSQPDIDGGLIGGASLKAEDFVAICLAAVPR